MSRDMKKKNSLKRYCNECGEAIKRNEDYTTLEVYDSPWGACRTIYVHVNNKIQEDCGISCEQALYDEHWADFRYFDCPMCNRTIIRQCSSNGWHSYVRELDGEEVCLCCWEKHILENGLSRESFEYGTISGMFFNAFEIPEGYENVDGYDNYFINSKDRARRYCDHALALIDEGCKLLNGFERIAIGGSEGYVTMFKSIREGGGK